ncbi:MAG: division/cell wall cluster transcriptional repressor MraZ [Flavisolibacter sp.]
MFFGKCALPLSENCQLTLPSNYREAGINALYITQGFDRNLILLSPQAFNAIYSQVKNTSISDPLARLLNRLFLGSATVAAMDDSGQLELPANLCEYAELGNEIVIVGQGEYLEIWSPALWQNQLDSLKDFEANAHRFEKFQISLS